MNPTGLTTCPQCERTTLLYLESVDVYSCTSCGADTWWSEDDQAWITSTEEATP